MKKNRMISVLLIIVMMVLSAAAVTAEEEKSEDTYALEVKTMKALGFLKSINTEDEKAAVTKGMFTAAVVELMGYGKEGSSGVSPFSDVTPSTAFYHEICLAAQYGIVQGDEAMRFNPDTLISHITALVILENAMGYYTQAMNDGGYPEGYVKTAANLRLNKGIKAGLEEKLNVGMCAKLLLNAGETPVVNARPYDPAGAYEKGEKLFWERHKIAKDSGVVKANEHTAIDTSSGAGKNGIVIGDVEGYIYFSNESTEYLGYRVEFYYREEDSANIILYMQPKNTNVTVINGADVDSFEDQRFTYYEGQKTKTESIPKAASVIFNGVYTIDYFFEDGTSIFCPEYGEVKLIDNDSDGKTDVVSILAYQNIVVSAVDREAQVVYDKYKKDNKLDYSSPEDTWIITDSSGNIISFDDLKKWDIVSVAKSMDNRTLRGVANRTSFDGTILAIATEDGKKTVTTENGKYFVAKSFSAAREIPKMGTSATFYLDYYGNIAAIEDTGAANHYGFLIKSYYDQELDRYTARLMNGEGVISNVSFSDKVKVDGDNLSGSVLGKRLGISDGEGEETEDPSVVGSFSFVSYKMNGKGEINYLDSVRKGPNEDEHTLYRINSYEGTYLWFSVSRVFGVNSNSVCMDPNTLIFKTPAKEFLNDTEDYGMGSLSELVYGTQYTVHAYSTNPDSPIPEAVHMPLKSEDASSMPRNARTCLIKDIYESVNEEDAKTWVIEYYSGTAEYKTYVAEDVDASKYQVGDIIKVTMNARGEISYINHVYSVDIYGFSPENQYGTGSDFGNEYQPYAAKLFVLDNDVIGITSTINGDTSFGDCTFQRITDKDTMVYTVKPGRNGREITQISAGDLPTVMDYYHNGQETPVYLMTTYGVAKVLVIYKLDED